MVVSLISADQQGQIRRFQLVADLEAGFTFLDNVIKTDNKLIEVSITVGNQESQLPTHLLEEQSWMPGINALEREWNQVLNDPVPIRALYEHRLTVLKRKRAERHQICITCLEQLVVAAKQRVDRILASTCGEPYRSRTLYQLEGSLKRYQQNLITERTALLELVDQLA